MLVYVNTTPVTIFTGATALDAVRRYYADRGLPTPPSPEIRDTYGNRIAPDSPMTENRRIEVDF